MRTGRQRRIVPWSVAPLVCASLTLPAQANVVGSDLQNFNTTTNGIDFVTVQSSETLEPGIFNFGLFLNHAVNSLPYFSKEGQSQNRFRYNDALTTSELNIGLGLFQDFEIGISVPYLLRQSVEGGAAHGEFDKRGVTNFRPVAKYRIWGTPTQGVAIVGSAVINRIRNNPYVGDGGSSIYIVELAGDSMIGPVTVGLNLGYRWRKKGRPIEGFTIKPVGDQIVASAAASYLLPGIDLKLIGEIFGSRPTSGTGSASSKRQASSAELLVGVKQDLTTNLALHVGGATELLQGVSSPDWRAYVGVNWAVGPVFERKPEVAEPPAPHEGTTETVTLHNIHFAFGSSKDVLPGASEELDQLVAFIKKPPPVKKIFIEGHTDSVGSESFNMELSVKRAETVRQHLINRYGLDGNIIEAVGYGESRPIADNGNYQGRQKNRRVEIRIVR